jgi:hypothetical protein
MPPYITPFSVTPSRSASPTTFSDDMDTYLSEATSRVVEQNAAVTWMNDTANTIAGQAAVASGAVGAVAWVSGTTYAIGNVRYSPINFLAYRRKTAGAGVTDPSLDATNWALAAGQGDATSADIANARAFAIAMAVAL